MALPGVALALHQLVKVPAHESPYSARGRARDGKCFITGLQAQKYSRLTVAHIFARAHDAEWIRKGYPGKITADEAVMGGSIKIDSVQNVITLRRDLHDAWDNYEFGVDPTRYEDYDDAFGDGSFDLSNLKASRPGVPGKEEGGSNSHLGTGYLIIVSRRKADQQQVEPPHILSCTAV
ncbi:hypothetical protein EI94DRAFT_1784905 [Lactarius quietus]|nr:hypothetical protein EI94DRAFT_1784905 [Lactarius quietus]